MTRRSWLPSLALVALAVAAPTVAWLAHADGRTASATTPSIAFSPATSTVAVATPVPVDITVADVSGLGGYDVWVSFSGSVVQLNSLKDSGLLYNPNAQGTPQNPVVCITPTITASYGHMACQILAIISPVAVSVGSTPAALVHASFGPLAGGTSPLDLTAVVSALTETTSLVDLNSAPIGASLGGGSIVVNAVPSVGGVAQQPDTAALPQQGRTGGSDHRAAFAIAGALLAIVLLGVGLVVWRQRAKAD